MSEKITFKELVDLIAEQSQQSSASTNSFLHELVRVIEEGLKNEGTVTIAGFGKFELRRMDERPGRNPRTGEEITIPAQNRVVFKPFKALREDINRPFSKMKAQVLKESEEKEKKIKTVPVFLKTGPKPEEDPADEEELIFERESPVKKLKKESGETPAMQPAAVTPKKPAAPGQKKKKKRSGFLVWSSMAAIVIILLAILAAIVLMQIEKNQNDGDLLMESPEVITSPEAAEPDNQEEIGLTDEEISPQTETGQETTAEAEDAPAPETEPESETVPENEEREENIPEEIETEAVIMDPGLSLWDIANTQIGNPYLWPLIYHLNSDILSDPNSVIIDTDLRVPVSIDPDNLTDLELEQTALGYLSVYQWMRNNRPAEAQFYLWAVGVFSTDVLERAANEVDPDDFTYATSR